MSSIGRKAIRKILHDFGMCWLYWKIRHYVVGFKEFRRHADVEFGMTCVNLIVHAYENDKQ